MTTTTPLTDILDAFCPMHLMVNAEGVIVHCGPTLKKLRDAPIKGERFDSVFVLTRNLSGQSFETLSENTGKKVHVQFKIDPVTELKGVLVAGQNDGDMILNLSFGISIVDGVRDYALNAADFAATDLTVELLYLVEAKSAAMEASRKLNLRLRGAMIAAEEQAFTDTLTGLKNRRALDHVLKRHSDWEIPFALLQVDLDWFKAVNDTFGHAAGDHVLQSVARIFVEETRQSDTVARVGGDEFCIVLPESPDKNIIRRVAQRIIDRLDLPINYEGQDCNISCSVGVAFYDPRGAESTEDIVSQADIALYEAKRAGRGRQAFFDRSMRYSVRTEQAPIPRTG